MTLTSMPAYSHGGPFTAGHPDFVVWHCTESDNNAGTAESLAGPGWFGGAKAGTSAHEIHDRDSGVEMVRDTVVAYHAGPKGNTYGWSIELCGRAEWSVEQWQQPEQLAMLLRAADSGAAKLLAIATRRKVDPLSVVRWLSVVQVGQLQPGMCTHNDVRLAFPGTTTHSDPGPNFPYALLLAYVLAAMLRLLGRAPATPTVPTQQEEAVPTQVNPGESVTVANPHQDGDLWVAADNPTGLRVDLDGDGKAETLVEGVALRVAVQVAPGPRWAAVDQPGWPVIDRAGDAFRTNVSLGATGARLPKDAEAVSVLNQGHIPVWVTIAPHQP